MRATHAVKNSKGNVVGFVVDDTYLSYAMVVKNVKRIENMTLEADNIEKVDYGKLPIIDKCEVNKRMYQEICNTNPIIRDVQKELTEWKTNFSEMVLYLLGARQIGKTTELLKFAYNHYENIIYINLANAKEEAAFEQVCLSENIYFGMLDYCEENCLEEFDNSPATILIIDEIQENATIYNSIRALQSGFKCHIAVTGSYLGKTLNAAYFKPAGNLYDVEMLSLSFLEFCREFQQEELLLNIGLYGTSASEEYKVLTDMYRLYRTIGGYPAVVKKYREENDIDKCMKLIETLLARFTEESGVYFKNDKCKIVFENVYKAAFLSIAKEKKGTSSKDIAEITEFVKDSTKEHVSRAEINQAISWLKYSKIIGSCDLYNNGNVFELLYERRFYFMDCGIANYIAQQASLPNDAIEGILTENFAYTELYRLYKTNQVKGDKPCCAIYDNYELDFMLVDKADVKYGIEIKNSNSTNPKSLNKFKEKKLIDEAYLAGVTKGGIRDSIKAIPVYTVGCRFPYE